MVEIGDNGGEDLIEGDALGYKARKFSPTDQKLLSILYYSIASPYRITMVHSINDHHPFNQHSYKHTY